MNAQAAYIQVLGVSEPSLHCGVLLRSTAEGMHPQPKHAIGRGSSTSLYLSPNGIAPHATVPTRRMAAVGRIRAALVRLYGQEYYSSSVTTARMASDLGEGSDGLSGDETGRVTLIRPQTDGGSAPHHVVGFMRRARASPSEEHVTARRTKTPAASHALVTARLSVAM